MTSIEFRLQVADECHHLCRQMLTVKKRTQRVFFSTRDGCELRAQKEVIAVSRAEDVVRKEKNEIIRLGFFQGNDDGYCKPS